MSRDCELYQVLELIGGKWKPLILFWLKNETLRFGQLRQQMPEVSQKVLTQQLRELEQDGIICREVFPEVPPRVEYSLSSLGCSLIPPLQSLHDWVVEHADALAAARKPSGSNEKTGER